jgi:hypothetical protein
LNLNRRIWGKRAVEGERLNGTVDAAVGAANAEPA